MSSPLPGPMTESSYSRSRDTVEPHDHAVCVYDSPQKLTAAVRRFVDEGLARNELCIFIHSFATAEEAWEFLESARPDVRTLHQDQVFVVSLYRDAFQGAKERIDYDHVTSVVGSLLDTAARADRRGVRIFVDASRAYFHEKRDQEWFAFESWLGRRLQSSVGLVCAYRHEDATRPDLFPEMLRTHAYRFDASAR